MKGNIVEKAKTRIMDWIQPIATVLTLTIAAIFFFSSMRANMTFLGDSLGRMEKSIEKVESGIQRHNDKQELYFQALERRIRENEKCCVKMQK